MGSMRWTGLALLLAAGATAPQAGARQSGEGEGGAQEWRGASGAEPERVRTPEGCFLYPGYVVLVRESRELGQDIVVKDRRAYGQSATPAVLCAEDGRHVLLRRPATGNDFFHGISRDVLLVDSGTAPSGRELLLQQLTGRKRKASFGYHGELGVRARGDALYLFTPVEVADPRCPASFYEARLSRSACREKADALWRCMQEAAAPRLDASPDPFAAPGLFSEAESGEVCQLEVFEQWRVDLRSLQRTPTGHTQAAVFFQTVD